MSEIPNPYAPPEPGQTSVEPPRLKTLRILPIEFPNGSTRCSYFSYAEFASVLTADLIEASKPFGVEALPAHVEPSRAVDATLRCRIHDIRHYYISAWQRIISLCFPFIGYHYFPASFTISGVIEFPNQPAVPFQTVRNFERGGLGEKANMRNGIRAEAIRLIGLAAKELEANLLLKPRSNFWRHVLLIPLVSGFLSTLVAYLTLNHLWSTAITTQDAKLPQIFVATILAILVPLLTIVLAPEKVYSDRRATWAYRMISSSRSLTLRVFIFICSLIGSFLVALAWVIMWANVK